MDSNNPKTLAPIPSQCTPYSYYCRPSEVSPNIPDRPELQKRDTRKFANICEFVSEICEFHLEKLIHFYIQNVFFFQNCDYICPTSITNLRIYIDNLRNYLHQFHANNNHRLKIKV